MKMYDRKHELYEKYCRDLQGFMVNKMSDADIHDSCEFYINSKDVTWKNIFAPGEDLPVGFLIIGKGGDEKHPDSIRSVAEAFVLKGHRGRGLMTETARRYIVKPNHAGIWSLLVFRGNEDAICFWNKFFNKVNYEPCSMSNDLEHAQDREGLLLLGFRPKSNTNRTV